MSTFSTARLRTKVIRGSGSGKTGLAMDYKLPDSIQAHWHKITGAEPVALIRADATFIDGKLQEKSDTAAIGVSDTDTEDGSVAA